MRRWIIISLALKVPGAHAAAFSALVLASHRLDVWLGGAAVSDDSFPLTDGGDLPADRMFRAALTSRSCVTPHALHTQVLTTSMSKPVGPERALQLLHVRVESLSVTMITLLLALVLQLRLEHAPAGIQYGFGHPGLCQLQAAHIADFDDLIVVYDLS